MTQQTRENPFLARFGQPNPKTLLCRSGEKHLNSNQDIPGRLNHRAVNNLLVPLVPQLVVLVHLSSIMLLYFTQ